MSQRQGGGCSCWTGPLVKGQSNQADIDYCKSKLLEQIEAGNFNAIIFYLRTIGKNRGFTERLEVAGVSDQRIVVYVKRVPAPESLDEPVPLNRDPGFIEAQRACSLRNVEGLTHCEARPVRVRPEK